MVHGLILVKSIGILGEVYEEIYWSLGEEERYTIHWSFHLEVGGAEADGIAQ